MKEQEASTKIHFWRSNPTSK